MKFTVNTLETSKQHACCLVIGVFADSELTLGAKHVDSVSQHAISDSLENGDFSAKLGQTLLLTNLRDLPAKRVLLVGCGDIKKFTEQSFLTATKAAFQNLEQTTYETIGFYLTELLVPNRSVDWLTRAALIAIKESYYNFQDYKSQAKAQPQAKEVIF